MTQTALYRHLDAEGRLLYVGISLSAVHRLSQHMDASSWANQIETVKVQRFPTREEAHEAERQAIRDENPAHNLVRYPLKPTADDEDGSDEPVIDPIAVEIEQEAERSRYELLRAAVTYKPVYTLEQAADAIGMQEATLKWWIGEGECGHVILGTMTRPHKTHGIPFVYRRIGITGWQLIDLVEKLQRQSAMGTRILGERPSYAPRRALFAEPADGSQLPDDATPTPSPSREVPA